MKKQVQVLFKTKVKDKLIRCAEIYKSVFMDYEYLICSTAFKIKPYYIISATKDNYLHLTGVNTKLKASEFFSKCITKTLTESDFDFIKKNQTEKEVKGYVRKKMHVLSQITDILKSDVFTEEQFKKGRIFCSFATSTKNFTFGFVTPGAKSRPKTLLKGNHLKFPEKVDLILRKKPKSHLFSEIILGSTDDTKEYYPYIKEIISNSLIK